MKQIATLMSAAAVTVGIGGAIAAGAGYKSSRVLGGKMPPGYRD